MVGGLDHDVTAAWRPPLPPAQVREDLLDDRRVLDHGDEPHLAAAAAAPQDVFVPHSTQKIGPGQTPRALGIVRADEGVSVGRPLIYSYG